MNASPPQPQSRPLWERLRAVLRKLGRNNGETSLRESVEEVIEEHEEAVGPLSEDERAMLLNVLKYHDLKVGDIMVPRADIVAVEAATPFTKLVSIIADAAHSRLPVYQQTLDEVIGMVHVKDVIHALGRRGGKKPALKDMIREVIVVPPSMKLIDLLKRMKGQRVHMAIVVDEFGGTDGLVTIEDLVEQIVGEIEDEYDISVEPTLTLIGKGVYEADARIPLSVVEQELKCDFLADELDETVDTLGGLVAALEGRVPEPGETVDHELGFRFEVIDADPRRVKRLRIHAPAKQD